MVMHAFILSHTNVRFLEKAVGVGVGVVVVVGEGARGSSLKL